MAACPFFFSGAFLYYCERCRFFINKYKTKPLSYEIHVNTSQPKLNFSRRFVCGCQLQSRWPSHRLSRRNRNRKTKTKKAATKRCKRNRNRNNLILVKMFRFVFLCTLKSAYAFIERHWHVGRP